MRDKYLLIPRLLLPLPLPSDGRDYPSVPMGLSPKIGMPLLVVVLFLLVGPLFSLDSIFLMACPIPFCDELMAVIAAALLVVTRPALFRKPNRPSLSFFR